MLHQIASNLHYSPLERQPSCAEFYQYINVRELKSNIQMWCDERCDVIQRRNGGINDVPETGHALCRSSRQIQLRRRRRSFGISITSRQARLKMFLPSRRTRDRQMRLPGLSWLAGRAHGKCGGPRGRRHGTEIVTVNAQRVRIYARLFRIQLRWPWLPSRCDLSARGLKQNDHRNSWSPWRRARWNPIRSLFPTGLQQARSGTRRARSWEAVRRHCRAGRSLKLITVLHG